MKYIRYGLWGIILILCIIFAVSNKAEVIVSFWPTDFLVKMPLAVVIFISMLIAFFAGGLLMWFSTVKYQLRARKAEKMLKNTEAELNKLRQENAGLKAKEVPQLASD